MKNHGQSGVKREVMMIRRSLLALERSLRRLVPVLSATVSTNGTRKRNDRRRLSAKARASLVLQGRYMGFMRQLKPRQKAQVRKVKDAKGVRAAITRAKRLARA